MFEKVGIVFALISRMNDTIMANTNRDVQESTEARLVEDVAKAKRFIEAIE